MRYLDPKNDIAFKKIFGTHKDLCISLLNALLPLGDNHEIKDLEYVDSAVLPDTPLKKNSIVDVRCKDIEGREFLFDVEKKFEKKIEDSREEGRAEGRAEGEQIGMVKGEQTAIVKKVLSNHAKGRSNEDIADIFDLSVEEVERILRENA